MKITPPELTATDQTIALLQISGVRAMKSWYKK